MHKSAMKRQHDKLAAAVFRLPELEGECTPDAERKIIQCLGPLSS